MLADLFALLERPRLQTIAVATAVAVATVGFAARVTSGFVRTPLSTPPDSAELFSHQPGTSLVAGHLVRWDNSIAALIVLALTLAIAIVVRRGASR